MVDLPVDAKIPTYYIEDEDLRLQIYRRVAGLTSTEAKAPNAARSTR